jgi:hypothetical protein
MGSTRSPVAHVGEDTTRGGRGAVEGGTVGGGEEVEELVVLVSGEAGNGVGVSVDHSVESGHGGDRIVTSQNPNLGLKP